jgi:hypothetical protein
VAWLYRLQIQQLKSPCCSFCCVLYSSFCSSLILSAHAFFEMSSNSFFPVCDLVLMNGWPFWAVVIQYWVRNGVSEFSDFFFLCKCWKLFWNFPSLYFLLYCGQSAKLFWRWYACFSVQIFCFNIQNLKISLGILKIALLFEFLIFWFLIHFFLSLGRRWSYRLVSKSVGYYWFLSNFNMRHKW